MKTVVVGSGAREHAIIKKLLRDADAGEVLALGANAGIAQDVELLATDFGDVPTTVELIKRVSPDLVIIGPEAPLVAGLADALVASGLRAFGPTAKAARLEASKQFAKQVMAEAGVPTARADSCQSMTEVELAIKRRNPPYVVKDDSLAAGKGVVVTEDVAFASAHARAVIESSGTVLIEDHLPGREVSLFFVCDGRTAIPLLPARDYKRLLDGDDGPNTGGMGSFGPLPDVSAELAAEMTHVIAEPILKVMSARSEPFVGLLYAGLMINEDQPNVVEFNVRFGDPETQSVMSLLDSSLNELLSSAATGELASLSAPKWAAESAVTVVMAAEGYPQTPRVGSPIEGLAAAQSVPGVSILHAGTASSATRAGVPTGEVQVAGGRVLSVVGVGEDTVQARKRAYQAVSHISFAGMQYRTDIGNDAERILK